MKRISVAVAAIGFTGACSSPALPAATTTYVVADPVVTGPPNTTAGAASSATVPPDVVTPVGYQQRAATITTSDGKVCEICVWIADTGAQRSQGLMGVTDLGTGDGMAFVYDAPHTTSFWMKDTLLALTIAFFDTQGNFLTAFDMEPCVDDRCQSYPSPPNFVTAIEFRQATAADFGVGPGSMLSITDQMCD